MNFLYWPFAWIMKFCLLISGQYYLIALFFFALIMQAVLLPFAIKQQKSQVKSASFRPKEMAIRKKYAGRTDKVTQQKMMAEIQEAQQAEGISAFSGCLSMLPQLILVIILFGIVRSPITYSFNYENAEQYNLYSQGIDLIQAYKDAAEQGDATDEQFKTFMNEMSAYQINLGGISAADAAETTSGEEQAEAPLNVVYKIDTAKYNEETPPSAIANAEYKLAKLIKNPEYLDEIAEKYGVKLNRSGLDEKQFSADESEKLPNFSFFGVSLIDQPSLNNFNILLLIPLLVFGTQFASTKITRKLMPAQLGPDGKQVGGGIFMEVGLPLISAVFAFSFSAAVGVYWIWRTLISIGQQFLMAKLYPLPVFTKEDYDAAEREFKAKSKKKKRITIEVDEDDDTFRKYEVSGDTPANDDSNKYTYSERVDMLTSDDDDNDSSSGGSDDGML